MRTSGRDTDLVVIAVPAVVLIVAGLAFAGDVKILRGVEQALWNGVYAVGRWAAALLS